MAVVTGIVLATSAGPSLVNVQASTCQEGRDMILWHFVITQLESESVAPSSIHVVWSNGAEADVDLDKFTGGTAHYTTTDNPGYIITSATADLPEDWPGQFNLSHVYCEVPDPLDISKTANPSYTRTWDWDIDKVADATYDMFTGDSVSHEYTVSVDPSYEDSDWQVTGQITIHNPNAWTITDINVGDSLDNGGVCVVDSYDDTLLSGETLVVDYTCTYSTEPSPKSGINTATVGYEDYDETYYSYHAHQSFEFTDPTTEINPVISVDDTYDGELGSADRAYAEWSYSRTFTCDGDEGTHVNTATINETGESEDATVVVNCYALQVTKDAYTSFTRTYDWTIDKTGDQSELTLEIGQPYTVNYTIVVDASYTDSDWTVDGNISVYNPAPMAATLVSISDVVSDDIAATVDCGVTFPYELAAGGTLNCTYSADLPDATDRLNTATAELQNTPSGTTNFPGMADVLFENAEITEIDECIDVTDSYYGDLGTVCYADLPVSFQYSRVVGAYATCGDYEVNNTASFVANDTETTGDDSWIVDINVPCNGCTLTIGYWKTHAGFGPQDDMLSQFLPKWLGTHLFDVAIGKSIQVTTAGQAVDILSFNNVASNGINKLYAQLLAAKLNIAAGASGSSISSSITAADLFLTIKNADDWSSLTKAQQKSVLAWITTFDNFNNGLIGPGHCSQ